MTGQVPATRLITDREIYEQVLQQAVPDAREFVWIGTADIKDLHIHRGSSMVPFLALLSDLAERGVMLRLLHAKEPGPAFRRDFDRYPNLLDGLEMILCPRVHFKSVIVDGRFAFSGSANLTGAGMGAKSVDRRNFESGVVTTEPTFVEQVMQQFDQVWMGERCVRCQRKKYCATFLEIMPTS